MAISLSNQPNQYGISLARSPIIYKYTGCSSSNNYVFNLQITTGSTASLSTYISISRGTDTSGFVIVDVSNIVKNYIKNNINFNSENIVYIKSIFQEYSNGVLSGTTTSNTAIASLGFSMYEDGINHTDQTSEVDYIMNNLSQTVSYSLPNYSGSTFISWRKNYSNYSTSSYKINYTKTNGTAGVVSTNFSTILTAKDEVLRVKCGYYDLLNTYSISDADYTKPIVVNFYNGATLKASYTFTPEECNGNELNSLTFINRWGVWDKLFLTGRKDTSFETSYDTYKFNNVNYSTMSYDSREGSYKKFNVKGKSKIILNTGWVDDIKNEQLKDIFLSEYLLLNDTKPVIITDKDIKFKIGRYDKLVNYTLSLENAYDEINNII